VPRLGQQTGVVTKDDVNVAPRSATSFFSCGMWSAPPSSVSWSSARMNTTLFFLVVVAQASVAHARSSGRRIMTAPGLLASFLFDNPKNSGAAAVSSRACGLLSALFRTTFSRQPCFSSWQRVFSEDTRRMLRRGEAGADRGLHVGEGLRKLRVVERCWKVIQWECA